MIADRSGPPLVLIAWKPKMSNLDGAGQPAVLTYFTFFFFFAFPHRVHAEQLLPELHGSDATADVGGSPYGPAPAATTLMCGLTAFTAA